MSLYAVGKIIGCFGVQGDVKVQPITHSVERLTLLRSVAIGSVQEETTAFDVDRVTMRDRIVIMRFKHIEHRTAAQDLVGKYVFVRDEDVVTPKQGYHFTHDIIGSDVYSTGQRYLGSVEDVYRLPAQDVWVIRNGEKRYMIPAVKEFVKSVNTKERTIIIEVIEGLIDE